MAFIRMVFDRFESIISDWSVWQIALLIAVVPFIAVLAQFLILSKENRFYKANKKLKRFLKRNCYVSTVNLFLFNKKVSRVFPLRMRKALKSMEGKDVSMQEIVTIFENCRIKSAKNIQCISGIAHVITVGVVMAMSGYYISHIAFVALGMAIMWGLLYIGVNVLKNLFRNREARSKNKFLFALKHSVQEIVKFGFEDHEFADISQQKNVSGDSVYELARGVEDFLATKPNKSLAKVVYKSLYSANLTSATSKESVTYLKDAMQKLKNYSV